MDSVDWRGSNEEEYDVSDLIYPTYLDGKLCYSLRYTEQSSKQAVGTYSIKTIC